MRKAVGAGEEQAQCWTTRRGFEMRRLVGREAAGEGGKRLLGWAGVGDQ